jgi:hypothetical protein
MRIRRVGIVLGVIMLFGQSNTALARTADATTNCVTKLVADGQADSEGAIHATPVLVGCYDTYSQALAVATAPSSSDSRAISREDAPQQTALGTEWARPNFNGTSNTYSASSGCNTNTWTVDDLGSFNNTFQSGKGFGSCNSNHKYAGLNESGDSINCTPKSFWAISLSLLPVAPSSIRSSCSTVTRRDSQG